MNVTLYFSPTVEFTLNEEDVTTLMHCCKHHYDRECKQSGQQGGVVFGFNNYVEFSEEGQSEVRATMNELDLLRKITEMTGPTSDPELNRRVYQLHDNFGELYRTARDNTPPSIKFTG